MDQDTKTESATALTTLPLAPVSVMTPLWYCRRCTNMILPPGSTGSAGVDGERFCSSCAPFEIQVAPSTSVFKATPSTRTVSVAPAVSSVKAASHIYANAPKNSDETSFGTGSSTKPRRFGIWLVLGAVAAIVIAIAVFSNSNGSGKTPPPASRNNEPITMKSIVLGSDKLGTGTDKKKQADTAAEKDLRAAPISGGGLFAAMQPGGGNDAVATPDKPVAGSGNFKATPVALPSKVPVNEPTVNDFEAKFKSVAPLIDADKYADADALLVNVSKEFSKTSWWAAQEPRVAQARETWKTKNDAFETRARDAANEARTASQKDVLDRLEADWNAKMAGGASAAKAAKQVLDAVKETRERLAKEDAEARMKVFAEAFEKIESRSAAAIAPNSAKMPKVEIDAALKTLQQLKTQMKADCALADKFCERWAAVNFDLSAARGAEQYFFHLDLASGDLSDLSYDFSNADQVNAWKFEGDGANSGAVEFETGQRHLLLKATGEHHYDPKTGKRVPMATLPFYMSPNGVWTFDVDASTQKVHNRGQFNRLPLFGIMVADDGPNSVRFFVREHKKNELMFWSRGAGDEKETTKPLAGKQDDKIHFRITCRGNRMAFSAGNGANGKIVEVGTASLGFEPKSFGLFVETADKDENTAISFDNVKISGSLDRAKIGAALSQKRQDAINAAKAEFCKTSKAAAPAPGKK